MTILEKKEKTESLSKENTEEENSLKNENIEKKSQAVEEITLEDKLKAAEEKALRIMAEMENQRRRFEKERNEAFEYGGYNFAKETVSLLDNVERAISSFKNDESLKQKMDLEKIISGIEIVNKDLISIFKKNGIEQIECINKKFDPNFHQAMLEVENNEKDPGTVFQEIQKGYMMKDRLLRPSLVAVTKKKEEKVDEITKDDEKSNKNDEKN